MLLKTFTVFIVSIKSVWSIIQNLGRNSRCNFEDFLQNRL